MKNIALIKSIVATSISSANPAEHIAALIQAHPEDQVELTCNSSNYTNLSSMGEPTVNLLEGTAATTMMTMSSREKAYKDSTSVAFDIREWNTGKVVWKR